MRKLIGMRRPRNVEVRVVRLDRKRTLRVFGRRCSRSPAPALLWMHGGGYTMGNARLDDRFCHGVATALDIVVASVDYRLAPEHPYPAALEDCHAAWQWLVDEASVDATRIAIGGQSSGAGLAAALSMWMRDRGDTLPVLQLLSYPMVDDRSSAPPHPRSQFFRFWNQRSNRFCWDAYLSGSDRSEAVPGRRDDLSGLPPAWMGVGSLDLFYDEDVRYAQNLRSAGVQCELHVVEGAFHGFDSVAPSTAISRAYFARQCVALHDAFSKPADARHPSHTPGEHDE